MSGASQNTIGLTVQAGMDVSGILGGVKQIQGAFNGLKINPNLTGDITKEFSNLQNLLKDYQKSLEKGVTSKSDLKNLEKMGKAIDSSFAKLSKLQDEFNGRTLITKVDSTKLDELRQKVKEAQVTLANTFSGVAIGSAGADLLKVENSMISAANRSKTLKESFNEAFSSLSTGNIEQFTSSIDASFDNLESKLKSGKLETTAKSIIETFKELGLIDVNIQTDTAEQKIVALKQGFTNLKTAVAEGAQGEELKGLIQNLETATIAEKKFNDEALKRGQASLQKQINETEQLRASTQAATQAEQQFQQATLSATQQVEQLQQTTQYFFSLRNMINLLKRGIDQAVDSVKNLDKAMTETAVVTEFSVSDMWAKLPEYTANANALGATIQDMYESTTLYYQQGLNTEQAMSIATETMKMARIAGLEAAEATDMMTAALRGFNMEINETSAEHINDVYSNLAAKTASNTEELGTAMQRTASIAHSAGMSFEGTAAFLAQAIETTREPAENLGTAMKTIVARFQELKKNPLEIVEVDGEEVSYNKVDTALQSIGVSLKDANGQFRALDEVFLDISKKWDSLSQTQQRYVATMAAGSRQQSRFIAMMSDYGRTVELMSYANNSAGASQEQFSKTMESFEAKVNKLKNAWQQFTMGIANEKFVKGAVDGLTNLLTTINKIIDKISGGNGLRKSLLSIATAFIGLKTGGRIINKLIGGLGGLVDPTSNFFSGFKGGAIKQGRGGTAQAKAISDPIVAAVNRIYGILNKGPVEKTNLSSGTFQDYKNKQLGFRKAANENATVGQVFDNLKGLDKKQISTILNNNPGIEMQLQRTANQYIKGLNLDKGVQDLVSKSIPSMFKAFKNDPQMSPESFVKAFRPDQIGKTLIKAGEPAGKQLIQNYANDYKQFFEQRQQDWAKQQQDFYGREITAEKHRQLLQSDQQYRDEYNQYSKRGVDLFNNKYLSSTPILQPTKLEKAAQGIGAIGAAFGTAGMAVSSFGNALSSLGLEKAGKLFTNLGNKIASVGSIISSVAMTMNQIQLAGGIGAITSAAWFAPLMTVMGAIAATGLLVGGSLLIANKQMQKIKESAEDITKTFEETNEETKDNIASLKQYQTQAANWAKGVDINGNNINLSDDDYNTYLEAIDKIAELNPEIVQGYNAQGHAILNINDALKETIALQEKEQKRAFETYTSQSSLESLLAARNISTDYYKNTEFSSVEELSSAQAGRLQKTYGDISLGLHFDSDANVKKQIVPLKKQTQKIAKELQQSDLFKQDKQKVETILDAYGINFDDLLSGEKDAVNRFVNNQDAIQNQLSNAAEKLGVDFKDSFNKSFETLGEDTAKFEATIEPIYQNLATRVSNSDAFKNIAPEFQSAVMSGLKEIAKEDLSANDMIKASNALIKEFDNLTSEGSAYATAMGEVEKAQDQFAQSLDAAEYAKGTENALETLNHLMEQYAGKTDSYSQAIAEYLQNQIDRIKNFTEEGAVSLTESLNSMTNEIASAEGAYDRFKETAKSDFATAADSMKSIFDELTKETDGVALHMEGKGDKAFWAGAESLFGAEALVDKTPQQVKKMFDRIEPMLQDGRAGFDAFWTDVFSDENYAKLKEIDGVFMDQEDWSLKWDDNINPEVFHEMATALGMSDEFLTSMLNKGRQFGAIDFMDTEDVRKALSTDVAAVKGTSTTKTESGQVADMFVKGDYLKSALADAGMVTPQDQQEAIDRLASEGVHIIKDPDQISTNDLKGMGITDMASAIKILGDTGQYTKDEIQAYAEKLGDYTPEDFADGYQQYLDTQEHPEIESIQSIQATVEQIASLIASQQVQEGHLADTYVSEDFKRAIYGEANKRDTQAQLFSVGKNEQGNVMTAQQYQFNLAELQKAQLEAQNYINVLTSGMKNASGQDLENMKAEKATMEQTLGYLNEQIIKGKQAWTEAYAQQQYDLAYKSALDAGASVQTAKNEAEEIKQDALQKAKEIVDAAEEGMSTGLTSGDTSGVKRAGKESAQKYTDTGTGGPSTGSTITNSVEFITKGAEEAKKQVDDITTEAEKPSTKEIKFDTSGAGAAKDEIKKVTDTGTGGNVKVGASLDSGAASKIASSISSTKANIPVGIKDNATSAAEKIRKGIDSKSATIDIKPNYTGSWTKTITVKEQKAATGLNNKIEYHHVPMFGSAASGTKKGRVGPKNQGGVTLTGEEGYEIGYIPSQGTSMILGMNGPQMINLPKDAIIYNHEQSKDILKRKKTIAAGSASGSANYKPGDIVTNYSSSGSTKNKNKGSSSSKSSDSSKKVINNFSIEEVIRFNIDQKLTKLTEAISKKTKEIEKTLDKISTRYSEISDSTKDQAAALQAVKNYNQQLIDSYTRQYQDLLTKQIKVSYTDKNGKSQEWVANLRNYLNADGTLKQSTFEGLKDPGLKEAIFREVNSISKTYVDGIRNAQKAIEDAENQLAELGKKVSETFYQWENELTEVYDLTQRINNESSFTDRFMSQVELELSKLNAGFGETAESISNTRKVLTRNNAAIQRQIQEQKDMIAARQRELEAALSYQDELEKLQKYQNQTDWGSDAEKEATIEWASQLATGAELGYKYIKGIIKDLDGSVRYNIDWEQFNADNEADPYSKATYEAIKDYLDKLSEAEKEFNDSIQTQTDFIKQTYDALREYQDYVANMEDTLIKGLEEEVQEAKNNAKKISDSITNALKDLLDQVKRKLDERRKQEDNEKTERDISQKQQRLAALRADTAGGHQVEIAQLEKEIADAQQSYQRSLEDQLLDKLQQQADEAAKQRERQIDLMETGNEIDSSINKELVDMWLKDPQTYKEQIKAAWLEANDYEDKGEAGQYILENQFESAFAELVTAVEQSGFNNLEAPFTAIEDNTNTLVYLLKKLTEEEDGALVDVTRRNTEALEELIASGATLSDLKARGVDAATLNTLGYSAKDLFDVGYTGKELKHGKYDLRSSGISVKDLLNSDLDIADLKDAGFTVKELQKGGVTDTKALIDAGYSIRDVFDAYRYDSLKGTGYTAWDLHNEGFTAREIADALDLKLKDFVADSSLWKAMSWKEVGRGYFDVKDYVDAGIIDAKRLKKAGFTLDDLRSVWETWHGNSWKALKEAGYTIQDYYNAGLTYANAVASGFSEKDLKWLKKQLGYKTGGLASHTGPAWLDGTPSKPELVLNAADTKNFLALRDVLSSAMKSTGAVNNSYGGDVTYEVNINVDKLTSDYDVDKVADRVKKIIVKDAGYRNVTQVRNLR